jgi:hypothetical protein
MSVTVRSREQIEELENWAVEGQGKGTRYPGMSYEDGIVDTLNWLTGVTDTGPHEEEEEDDSIPHVEEEDGDA